MTDISKETQNKDNTQVPYTTQIASTNVENIDTEMMKIRKKLKSKSQSTTGKN